MLHLRYGARLPPDLTLGIQANEFNLGFIRPENLVSHGLESFESFGVLGHLPDQGLSPPSAQFGQVASYKKNLGDSKLLPFKNDGGHCVLGDIQYCRNVLVPFPRSVPRHNPVSELYGQSTSWLGFSSDMHYQLWDLI